MRVWRIWGEVGGGGYTMTPTQNSRIVLTAASLSVTMRREIRLRHSLVALSMLRETLSKRTGDILIKK